MIKIRKLELWTINEGVFLCDDQPQRSSRMLPIQLNADAALLSSQFLQNSLLNQVHILKNIHWASSLLVDNFPAIKANVSRVAKNTKVAKATANHAYTY